MKINKNHSRESAFAKEKTYDSRESSFATETKLYDSSRSEKLKPLRATTWGLSVQHLAPLAEHGTGVMVPLERLIKGTRSRLPI